MQRAILDTSILIGADPLPPELSTAISTVSIAELHCALLVAKDASARAMRVGRIGLIEARFPDPLPIDDLVAREWGRLQAALVDRGAKSRRRSADLAIAATAIVHDAVLVTHDLDDFKLIEDLVTVRTPAQLAA